MADHKSSLTDWIPVRMNLPEDPKVYAIAAFLFRNKTFHESMFIGHECDSVTVTDDVVTAVVVCALVRVWAKANEFGTTSGDDRVLRHTSRQTIDSWARVDGICEAMESVGWVVFDPEENTITLVRFRSYNKPKDDRARDAAAERQRIKRERDKLRDKDRDRSVTERDKSVTVTPIVEESREEKSTEKDNNHTAAVADDPWGKPIRVPIADIRAEAERRVSAKSPINPHLAEVSGMLRAFGFNVSNAAKYGASLNATPDRVRWLCATAKGLVESGKFTPDGAIGFVVAGIRAGKDPDPGPVVEEYGAKIMRMIQEEKDLIAKSKRGET